MTDQRTNLQNRSLHKLCTMYANALNDAGFDQIAVLEKKVMPTPNTMESVKNMFRLIQAAMYPKEDGVASTADLDTVQIQNIYRVLDKFMAENFGITMAWPSNETLMI